MTILTLSTQDGFSVSFGMTGDDVKRLEKIVRNARTLTRPIIVKN